MIILRKGQVVERGPAEVLLNHPNTEYAQRLLAAEPSRWPDPPRFVATPRPPWSAPGLAMTRGGRALFSQLEVSLRPGEIVGVVGPSGCGKSTLGDILLGVTRPNQGASTTIKVFPYWAARSSTRTLRPPFRPTGHWRSCWSTCSAVTASTRHACRRYCSARGSTTTCWPVDRGDFRR